MYEESEVLHPPIEKELAELKKQLASLKKQVDQNKPEEAVNIICFSGKWDKLYAALTIANGSLALGKEVHLFFTFWAISALQKDGTEASKGKSFLQKLFCKVIPRGITSTPLSSWNMFGLGKYCVNHMMKKKGIANIDTLYNDAVELGAHIHVCETSSIMFGFDCKELNGGDQLDRCGVTSFLSQALNSRLTLFI